MGSTNYVSRTKNCTIEISWAPLQMTRAEQDEAMRKIRALSEWRHAESINHTLRVTHLFPKTPSNEWYDTWYGKVIDQIAAVLEPYADRAKAARHIREAERINADGYIQWLPQAKAYRIIYPAELRLTPADIRALTATYRSHSKVKSVTFDLGVVIVTPYSTIEDDRLKLSLHRDTVHKAKTRMSVLAK